MKTKLRKLVILFTSNPVHEALFGRGSGRRMQETLLRDLGMRENREAWVEVTE